jgi:hypothetical protein
MNPFATEIANISWEDKRRLAKFAADLIARELHQAFGPESELEEKYIRIISAGPVSARLFGDPLEGL